MNVKIVWTTGLVDSAKDRFQVTRPLTWPLERKQLLMDSILRGYDLPKIYLRPVGDGNFAVLDGQQRLQALWEFYAGGFALSDSAAPVEEDEVAGKSFDTLSDKLRNEFDCYELDLVILDAVTDEAAEEMMARLGLNH